MSEVICEIVALEKSADELVIRAILERIADAFDPQDQYCYTQECVATVSSELIPLDISGDDLITLLEQIEPEWRPY